MFSQYWLAFQSRSRKAVFCQVRMNFKSVVLFIQIHNSQTLKLDLFFWIFFFCSLFSPLQRIESGLNTKPAAQMLYLITCSILFLANKYMLIIMNNQPCLTRAAQNMSLPFPMVDRLRVASEMVSSPYWWPMAY